MDGWPYEWMVWTERQTDGCTFRKKWISEQVDGQKDEWTDRWMVGWSDS